MVRRSLPQRKPALFMAAMMIWLIAIPAVSADPLTEGIEIDGDLDNDTIPGTDWAHIFDSDGEPINGLPDHLKAAFVHDRAAPDGTYHGGGNKDDQDLAEWRCVERTNPQKKSNILHGYALRQELDGGRELWLGMEREANKGATYMGIWLLQDEPTCTVGENEAGFFQGQHQSGDLLLLADFTRGGKDATIEAWVWDDTASFPLYPLYQDRACDRLTNPSEFCGQVNGAALETPWGGSFASLATHQFLEMRVNVTDMFGSTDAPCYNTVLFNTRASFSIHASLKDYAMANIGGCANGDDDDPDDDNGTGDDNSTGDNSTGNNSTGDNSTGDNSTGDNSTGDNSTGDNSTGDNSTGDNSTGDNSTGDNSTGDNSTGDNSTGDNSTGDNSTGDNSTGDNSTGDNSTGDNSTGNNSTGDNSTGDNSTGDNSTGDNSTGDNSTGDNSTGDNSTGDNSTGDNSTGDNSTGDNSTGDNDTGTNTTAPSLWMDPVVRTEHNAYLGWGRAYGNATFTELKLADALSLRSAHADSAQAGPGVDGNTVRALPYRPLDDPQADVVARTTQATSASLVSEPFEVSVQLSHAELADVRLLGGLVEAAKVRAVATAVADIDHAAPRSTGSVISGVWVNGEPIQEIAPDTRVGLPAAVFGPGSYVHFYETTSDTGITKKYLRDAYWAEIEVTMIHVYIRDSDPMVPGNQEIDLKVGRAFAFAEHDTNVTDERHLGAFGIEVGAHAADDAFIKTAYGNNGTAPAMDHQIEIEIPDGTSLIRCGGPCALTETGAIRWSHASLEPGQAGTIDLLVRLDENLALDTTIEFTVVQQAAGITPTSATLRVHIVEFH